MEREGKVAEDTESRYVEAVNSSFSGARAEMQLRAQLGEFKKGAMLAHNDLMMAAILIDSYQPGIKDDTNISLETQLESILARGGAEKLDFEKLQNGWKAYNYGTGLEKKEASEDEKKERDYFRKNIVEPLLKKHSVTENEVNEFSTLEVGIGKARLDAKLKKAWTGLSKRKKR